MVAATGGVGSHIVEQALAGGHEVTAVARNADSITSLVRVVRVDLSADGAQYDDGPAAGRSSVTFLRDSSS